MSLARSFTKRMKRPSNDAAPSTPAMPSRSQSVRNLGLAIDRTKISGPVALVSTTNMLSYNAPDIVPASRMPSSSSTSTHSADDSDHSVSTRSRASSHASRDTLTDASSVSSLSPTSPSPNHLTGYFSAAAGANKTVRKSASSGNLQQLKEHVDEAPAVPAIPERALSHSKRAHERLAQKRSLQNLSRARSSREHRASVDMFSNAAIREESHPFGKELEQLNEVAEEFNGAVRDAELAADRAVIREHNLASFCAAEYMAEIEPLFEARFGGVGQQAPVAWI